LDTHAHQQLKRPVSTAQLKELETAGCEEIFQEQVSSVAERLQLNAAEFVRDGDTFFATKLIGWPGPSPTCWRLSML
jgi:hypothetical protein